MNAFCTFRFELIQYRPKRPRFPFRMMVRISHEYCFPRRDAPVGRLCTFPTERLRIFPLERSWIFLTPYPRLLPVRRDAPPGRLYDATTVPLLYDHNRVEMIRHNNPRAQCDVFANRCGLFPFRGHDMSHTRPLHFPVPNRSEKMPFVFGADGNKIHPAGSIIESLQPRRSDAIFLGKQLFILPVFHKTLFIFSLVTPP